MKLYPLKLKPVCKTAIWGGSKIPHVFGIGSVGDSIAEAWMLTCREDGDNLIENGPAAGMTLGDYIKCFHGGEVTEEAHFPLLIKILDADKNLSVQVHPDDAYAHAHGIDAGKTEMWYILQAEEGAELYLGFEDGVTLDDIQKSALDGTLEAHIKRQKVSAGEVYFIPAGLSHAIGGGILLAEIQQNSNTTYRLYDYNRTDKDGKKRELHLENALEAIKLDVDNGNATVDTKKTDRNGVVEHTLVECDVFSAVCYTVPHDVELVFDDFDRMSHVLCVGGIGYIECDGAKYQLKKGDSYLIPRGVDAYTVVSERDIQVIISK